MPLFRSDHDIEFVKRITREVVERVISEKVTYYPISKQLTRENIYGESKEKVFDPPIEIYSLVEWLPQSVTTDQYGQDIIYNIELYIQDEYLAQIEVQPIEGDMVDYDNKKFEVTKVEKPTQIFAKSGRSIGYKLTCTSVRKSGFEVSISGSVENAKRTRPDEPDKVNVIYDDILFPYSGSKND